VKIAVQHIDGLRFVATSQGHAFVVDAAPQDGGSGSAPSAPQLFVAATGACILEFVANSCRLHGLQVDHLSVEVTCREEAGPRRLGAIEATLCILPEPPGDVKRRLIGVARHATLANTLARPPEVSVRFAAEPE